MPLWGWSSGDGKEYERLPDPSTAPAAAAPRATSSKIPSRALCALLHLVTAAFALYGVVVLVQFKLGRIVKAERITPESLQQAGWARRPLVGPSASSVVNYTSLPPLSADHHPAQLVLHEFPTEQTAPTSTDALHLLILTPLRNAAPTLPAFFHNVQRLRHPRANTSLGFLIGDESDESSAILYDWASAHATGYRRVSLLRKDFRMDIPAGEARHSAFKQDQRRSIMARARTFLVTATLEPTVDWVLWLDSDVLEVPPQLFSDLLRYGNAGVLDGRDGRPLNDIITPNIMWRPSAGRVHGYDDNNWAETPESLAMKKGLKEEDILVEGNILHPTYRSHLSEAYTPSNYSPDPNFLPHEAPADTSGIDRFDPAAPAYIGRLMPLDAVGGVATLVRATAHRLGAFFPPFAIDHQVETEGFGVVARKIGARIVGLPNYAVLHAVNV